MIENIVSERITGIPPLLKAPEETPVDLSWWGGLSPEEQFSVAIMGGFVIGLFAFVGGMFLESRHTKRWVDAYHEMNNYHIAQRRKGN